MAKKNDAETDPRKVGFSTRADVEAFKAMSDRFVAEAIKSRQSAQAALKTIAAQR